MEATTTLLSRIRIPLGTGLLLMLLLATSGCFRFRAQENAQLKPLPYETASAYDYQPQAAFQTKETEVRDHRKFRITEVSFEIQDQAFQSNRVVQFYYYRPKAEAPSPVIMILPVSGGSYDLEEYFARYFAKKGFACAIVQRDKIRRDEELVENINPLLHQTVLNNRLVMDWMETRPELDMERVGVFGASMGGIKGALLAPLDPRVKAAVLGLAGGDLPHVLAYSKDSGVTRRREKFLKQEQVSVEALEKKLRELITHDPLSVAPYVDPGKVLLILARWDKVVPFAKGWELREAMGDPEASVILAGHYSALVYIPYIQSRSYRFFRKRFEEKN